MEILGFSKGVPGVRVKERRLPHYSDQPGNRWHSSSPAALSAPSAGSWHPGTAVSHPRGPLPVSTPLLTSGFHYLNLGKERESTEHENPSCYGPFKAIFQCPILHLVLQILSSSRFSSDVLLKMASSQNYVLFTLNFNSRFCL